MVQFHVNQCGLGLMLGIFRCHVRSRHLLRHDRERKYLVLLPKGPLKTPGYPYREFLVVGRIGWDACPQNEVLTSGDVRARAWKRTAAQFTA